MKHQELAYNLRIDTSFLKEFLKFVLDLVASYYISTIHKWTSQILPQNKVESNMH
jgi:hypothetical protein